MKSKIILSDNHAMFQLFFNQFNSLIIDKNITIDAGKTEYVTWAIFTMTPKREGQVMTNSIGRR